MSNRENSLMEKDEDLRHQLEHLRYERDSIDDYKEIKKLNIMINDLEDERSRIHMELDYISRET